ncbi:MAG: hypothetical protein K9N21_20080 [Deltaproteobacteria bacterium]|nr:hypothetical protein [Deltaproteobacteria bacterium]
MRYRGEYWGYPPYVSVAEKRAKAARKLQELRKKKTNICPICIEGTTIARTWWGKSWNQNLESYADYSNRIGRGRSYVRHGAVLDLKIGPGKVDALVQGTRSRPYSVCIQIKPIEKKIWNHIKAASEGRLGSLQELLAGKFPKELGELFMVQGKGLFPSPKEIGFSCSCPDWAYMCKHVAASLYGIGARLDDEPDLFFKLRNVEMKDLVAEAIKDKTRKLLQKAKKTTGRVIAEADVADVFGIDMEDPAVPYKKSKASPKKASKSKLSLKRASKENEAKSPGRGANTKHPRKKAALKKKLKTPFETVLGIVKRSRKGVTVADIRGKTGFDDQQIRNCIYRAKQKGLVVNRSRGVYMSSAQANRPARKASM